MDLYAIKEILGHRDIQTTERYAHLTPDFLQTAINRGSLVATVTRTVTGAPQGASAGEVSGSEVVERMEERDWLGDQESNLGSQIQSLTSYR